MKPFIYLITLSSVLMACAKDDNRPSFEPQPMRNEVELSFIGTDDQDKSFGYGQDLSSVECRYDKSNNSIRVVAYRFSSNKDMKVSESLQMTDYAIQTNKSGFLKPMEGDVVPSFIFLSDQSNLKFTDKSNCSTYYEINGDEIKGNVLCSALESENAENTFVSMEFQCMNQNYLLFEIKEEMI